MKFAIVFDDNPGAAPDLRKQHMQVHLSFLERHGDAVDAAGPLSDDQGRVFGGLWIVEAETAAAADRLVREDPF